MGQGKRFRPSRNSLSSSSDEVARRDFERLFEIERADLVCDGLDELGAHAEQIAALLSQPRTSGAVEPGGGRPVPERPAAGEPLSAETGGGTHAAAQDEFLEARKAFARLE